MIQMSQSGPQLPHPSIPQEPQPVRTPAFIRALLRQQEERIHALLLEIREIRDGKWDDRLAAALIEQDPAHAGVAPVSSVSDPLPEPQKGEPSADPPQPPVPPDAMDVDQDSHDKPPDSETKPVVEQSESDMKIDEPPQGGNDDSSAETVKEEAVTEEPTVPVETVGMETDKPDNDDPMDQATEQSIAQDSTSTPNPDTTHEDHKTLEAHQPPLDDTLLSPTKRTAEEASDGEKRRATNFRRTCRLVWSKLAEHRCGNAFLRSPKEEKEPEYFKMIKRPMNLQIVKSRFREGETTTQEEFHRDIMLMLANTVMYNDEASELFQMVEPMKKFAEQEILTVFNAHRIAEAGGDWTDNDS